MKFIVESGQGPFEIAWSYESQSYWVLYHNVPMHTKPFTSFQQVTYLINFLTSKGM